MDQTIFRHEVLTLMDGGEPFDLVFITADLRRDTGGEIKRVKGWRKIKTDTPVELLPTDFRVKAGRPVNPQHRKNKTFNIFNPNNRGAHAYKVHWALMIFFNGKRIIS